MSEAEEQQATEPADDVWGDTAYEERRLRRAFTISQDISAPLSESEIQTRPGPHGKALRYVEWNAVLRRLLETAPNFHVDTVVTHTVVGGSVIISASCNLSIPGLGTRTGVSGDAISDPSLFETAQKGAASDAFKRAAVMFGIGLELYENKGGSDSGASQGGGFTPRPQFNSGGYDASGDMRPATEKQVAALRQRHSQADLDRILGSGKSFESLTRADVQMLFDSASR